MRNFSTQATLFFFFKDHLAFAQARNSPVIQKINHENGLSDNNIQCMSRDKNGFMWIGTSSGLNLLDRSDIAVFKIIRDDSKSISKNFIKYISAKKGLLFPVSQESKK